MSRSLPAVALLAFLATPGMIRAQGQPLGPEFRVNTTTTGNQNEPSVALDSTGNFVVVWESVDGSGFGIFGQRYASAGNPLGGEFRVNTSTLNGQSFASVAADAAGNFVVAWQGFSGAGAYDIFAQRFASTGAPVGGEFRVNTFRKGGQGRPSVASDPAGDFVVMWSGPKFSNNGGEVFGQRYASTGEPLGGEFRVNTYTTSSQGGPRIASDLAGNLVVTWVSQDQDGSGSGAFAQRYDSTGTPLGPEFRVNTSTASTDNLPTVAGDAAGNFVIVWYSEHAGSGFDVDAQRFASTGEPLGGEFRVNTYTTSAEWFPAVASDGAGNFVVAWESYFDQDGHYSGIFAQRFDSAGVPLGGEFRVNTYTIHDQYDPAIAADSNGHFVVVWSSYKQDGSNWGIFAQRYGPISGEALDLVEE